MKTGLFYDFPFKLEFYDGLTLIHLCLPVKINRKSRTRYVFTVIS